MSQGVPIFSKEEIESAKRAVPSDQPSVPMFSKEEIDAAKSAVPDDLDADRPDGLVSKGSRLVAPGLAEFAQKIAPGVFRSADSAADSLVQNVAIPVGETIDSVTGAPTRAAVGAYQDDKSPFDAFINQFGSDPHTAPTGKQIAQKAGVSDKSLSDAFPGLFDDTGKGWRLQRGGRADISASGAAGLGVDVAADWTNLIPPVLLAKELGAGAKVVGKTGARVGAEVGKGLAETAPKVVDKITGTTVASHAAEAAGDTARGFSATADKFLNPKFSKESEKLKQIAEAHGLDPDLVMSEAQKYGPESGISRISRVIREGGTGEKELKDFANAQKSIAGATDKEVEKLAGGVPLNDREMGQELRSGYKEGKKAFFDKQDITQDSVLKYAPGLQIDRDAMEKFNSTLNGAEKHAKGLIARGTPDQVTQGQYILKSIGNIRNASGSAKQMLEEIRFVRDVAFPEKKALGAIDHDTKALRDIYFSGQDAFLDTIRKHVNPEFADEIVKNNALTHEFLTHNRVIGGKFIDSKLADENLFSGILRDSKSVEAAKHIMKPETFQKLKGAYLNNLIERTDEGAIQFGKLRRKLSSDGAVLRSLFTPEEIARIHDIVHFGESHGPAVMSSSATGASHGIRGLARGAVDDLVLRNAVNAMKKRAARTAATGAKSAVDLGEKGAINLDALVNGSARFAGKRDGNVAQSLKAAQVASVRGSGASDESASDQIDSRAASPLRGSDKWANAGASKLGLSDDAAAKLMSSPMGKRLLIQASDLPAGSKAFKRIQEQIQKGNFQ